MSRSLVVMIALWLTLTPSFIPLKASEPVCIRQLIEHSQGLTQHLKDSFYQKTIMGLQELVSLKTLSTKLTPQEMHPLAEVVADMCKRSGLEHVTTLQVGDSMPFVVGDLLHAGEDKPTLMLYAHYDVVEIDDPADWDTDPFTLVKRGERLYGRGTSDDKYAIALYLSAIEAYTSLGLTPPVNIKVVFEGEEEKGSPHMAAFMDAYPERTRADVFYVADVGSYELGRPALFTSTRGYQHIGVTLSVAEHDNHGGIAGGALPDPQVELYRMIGNMVDEHGKLAIPGIEERVRPQEESIQGAWAPQESNLRQDMAVLEGVELLHQGSPQISPFHHTWSRPSIAVNSFGTAHNSIAGSVHADIALRLVPNMTLEESLQAMQAYFKAQNRHGLKLEVTSNGGTMWWEQPMNHEILSIAEIFSHVFEGQETIFTHASGTLPLMTGLQSRYPQSDIILYGAWDPGSRIHSSNESVDEKTLLRVLQSTLLSWQYLGR